MLAHANPAMLAAMAEYLASEDPYGERAGIEAAFQRIGRAATMVALVHHQVWCAHREAAWRTGLLDRDREVAALIVEGEDWVRETEGHPTVLISPMTVALSDAAWVIAAAVGAVAPGRRVVIDGDTGIVGATDPGAPGSGTATVRSIVDALAGHGVFSTCADFVPRTRDAVYVELFGKRHPISASCVSVASQPNTMLLPCLVLHGRDGGLRCKFYEPILVAIDNGPQSIDRRAWSHRAVAQLVGVTLETLIREAPHQWQLLTGLHQLGRWLGRP